ncbi:MAG: VIT1/CCC1 transporter family protein [Thermoanaerobaculia bacterium]
MEQAGTDGAAPEREGSKRALEPIDRVSEILFGLIMVLTFTGSLSAAESGRAEIRSMLVGALGCNLAWGLIDAIMYLMGCLSERAQRANTVRGVRAAATPEAGRRIVAAALPPAVAAALPDEALEKVRLHLEGLPEPPTGPRLHAEDWRGALAVFLLVVASTIPVVLPFVFMRDAMLALRVSNAIAVSMMFAMGYTFGRLANARPWLTGIVMVVLGAALVSLTMALGG